MACTDAGMDDALAKKIDRFSALKLKMPSSELPRWTLAQAYEEAQRFSDARDEYAALVELKPDYCLAWLRLGALYLGPLNDHEAARRALTEGKRLAVEQGHNAPRIEADSLLRELDGNDTAEDDDEDWPA